MKTANKEKIPNIADLQFWNPENFRKMACLSLRSMVII